MHHVIKLINFDFLNHLFPMSHDLENIHEIEDIDQIDNVWCVQRTTLEKKKKRKILCFFFCFFLYSEMRTTALGFYR
jgi:hypothetical protein